MAKRNKILIQLFTLFAAALLSVGFVHAQTTGATPTTGGGGLTAADINNVEGDIKAFNDLYRGIAETDPAKTASYNTILSRCGDLATKTEQITNGDYTFTFYKDMYSNYYCSLAKIIAKNQDKMPNYQAKGQDLLGRTWQLAIASDGQAPLAKYFEARLKAQAPDQSVTQESYQKEKEEAAKPQQNNSENGFWELISKGVGFIISKIIDVVVAVLLAVAAFAGMILQWCITHTTNAVQPEIIGVAWGMVRDVLNLIFIIALVVIAVATILRIESYNYKKLLGRLILMALLINFSKVIADTLVSIVDTLIGAIAKGADFTALWTMAEGIINNGKSPLQFPTIFTALSEGLFKLILALIMAVSFTAIAGLMVVRLVGIWMLIVLSPAAFALNILPVTQRYAKQWWNKFFSYLIWAPVSIFFLRIGMGLIQRKANGQLTMTNNQSFDLILISAFMMGSMMVAKAAGMAGASAVTGAADNALNKAKKFGQSGAKFAAGAAGSYVARGTMLKNLGSLAGGQKTGIGKGLQSAGNKVSGFTASVKTLPGAMKEKLINAPNAARKRQVDTAAARWQLKMGALKGDNVNKDNIGLLKGKLIWEEAEKGKITADYVENMREAGMSRSQLNVLVSAIREGKIKDPETAQAIQKALFIATGGKERNYPPKTDPLDTSALQIHHKENEPWSDVKVSVNLKTTTTTTTTPTTTPAPATTTTTTTEEPRINNNY